MDTLVREFVAEVEPIRQYNRFAENRARSQIREAYSKTNIGTASYDFDNPTKTLVYVKLYGAIHSTATNEAFSAFSKNSAYGQWRQRQGGEELVVLALGGGPGTDLLGILPVLDSAALPAQKIRCVVVDRCEGWEPRFRQMMQFLQMHVRRPIVAEFHTADMSRADLRVVEQQLARADLVCLVKFLSAMSRGGESVARLTKTVFTHLKPGSVVFYLDGVGGRENFGLLRQAASIGPVLSKKKTFEISSNREMGTVWNQDTSCIQYCFWVKPAPRPRTSRNNTTDRRPVLTAIDNQVQSRDVVPRVQPRTPSYTPPVHASATPQGSRVPSYTPPVRASATPQGSKTSSYTPPVRTDPSSLQQGPRNSGWSDSPQQSEGCLSCCKCTIS